MGAGLQHQQSQLRPRREIDMPHLRRGSEAKMLHPVNVSVRGVLGLPAAEEVGALPGSWRQARSLTTPWVHFVLGVHTRGHPVPHVSSPGTPDREADTRVCVGRGPMSPLLPGSQHLTFSSLSCRLA